MTLQISLPFGRKDNVKNLVFTILCNEYPLKIIELTNYIKKRYGKSVTFQAVRKAIVELVEEDVLVKEDNVFSINKSWVSDAKHSLDVLYSNLNQKRSSDIKSIEGEVTVLTFDSLNDLMKYWQDIIDDWFKKFKKGDYAFNCFQGVHGWEALLHPDREKQLMGQLKKKAIRSYSVFTGNYVLDRYLTKFYNKAGLKAVLNPSTKHFDKGFYVATYGDLIIQVHYPDRLIFELENFFRKNMTLEDLDLHKLSEIVNRKIKIKLTIIRNLDMAKHINQSIISQIE